MHASDRIVSELRLALDFDVAGDVGENLERLYLFVESALGRASVERTIEPLAEARGVLVTLLEAWNSVEIETKRMDS